ncbi:MAG: YqeG family HAD IIIA-type phosphatase [Bacillota bacterium]
MFRFFYPRLYVSSLVDVDLESLRRRGINSLIIDLDNTILPRGANRLERVVEEWLDHARAGGFRLCVVSNNRDKSARELTRRLGIPMIIRAAKPRRRPFLQALALMGATRGETAVIGDQIFTDVLGGNRLGLFTILIDPLDGKEFIGTRLVSRPLEKLFLPRIKKRCGGGRERGD